MGVSFCRNPKFGVTLKTVLRSKPWHDTFWVNVHTNWWQTQNWSRKPAAAGGIGGKQMISKDVWKQLVFALVLLLWRDAHKQSVTACGQRVGLTVEILGSLGQKGLPSNLGRLGLISPQLSPWAFPLHFRSTGFPRGRALLTHPQPADASWRAGFLICWQAAAKLIKIAKYLFKWVISLSQSSM